LESETVTPKTALYQLKNDPLHFLHSNLVVCAGGSTSAQRPFSFGVHGAYVGPRAGANEVFTFTTIPLVTPNPEKLVCDNVRMIKNTEPLDLTNLEKYTLGLGCDFMITGQLTGCAFCILQQGNTLEVAHVQPNGLRNLDGAELKTQLENIGRFAGINTPLTRVYGRGGDYNVCAYVIGVHREGHWQLWGQAVSSTGGAANIVSVTRII
jgi:hypothetical protein